MLLLDTLETLQATELALLDAIRDGLPPTLAFMAYRDALADYEHATSADMALARHLAIVVSVASVGK